MVRAQSGSPPQRPTSSTVLKTSPLARHTSIQAAVSTHRRVIHIEFAASNGILATSRVRP
jgi:hypothetical protein